MNKSLFLQVADTIEAHADQFNMNQWVSGCDPSVLLRDCGTTGCIGGWTNALCHRGLSEDQAARDLDISEAQAAELFYPYTGGSKLWDNVIPNDSDGYDATPEQAARLLRGLADGDYHFDQD